MIVSCSSSSLLVFVLALVSSGIVCGLQELPERARGGKAWRQYLKKNAPAPAPASSKATAVKGSEAQYWDAPIDHFNANYTKTYKQRYYVDSQYWDGVGPVFLQIGGEGTMSGAPGGYMAVLAQNYSALLVGLEHRFYGDSIPNGNVLTENLQYLAVDQALADLATFTDFFTEQYKTGDSKWFAFGGSYPGALSSWYRASYPDKTVGSLSSSGVVNCIINFPQFDMQVSAAIGNKCADQIKRINAAFEKTIASGKEGWDYATGLFYCEKDMWTQDFFYMIADSWSMADQYGGKSLLCDAILSVPSDADDVTLMTTFADFSNDYWGKDFCAGGFYNTEALADPARWDVNARSWRWQTCFEVSYFNTAPSSGSLRALSVNLDYHLKQCAHIFKQPMFPTSVQINQKYGGDIPHADKVYYSDFSDDPWQRASVWYPVSDSQPYGLAMCDDCGHCKDLHTPEESDPAPVKALRADFETYLSKWLSEK